MKPKPLSHWGSYGRSFYQRIKWKLIYLRLLQKSFTDITEIPVFNQFDNWRTFDKTIDINKLHDLTLYYVKVDGAVSNEDVMKKINEMRDGYRFMNIEKFQKKVRMKS